LQPVEGRSGSSTAVPVIEVTMPVQREDEGTETYMLDAYVIEEIKRREREQSVDERPVVELPVPSLPARPPERRDDEHHDDRDRGVVIIDYSG
jgi:hypothetical protein